MHRLHAAAFRCIPAVVAASPFVATFSNFDKQTINTTTRAEPQRQNPTQQNNSKQEDSDKPFNLGNLFTQEGVLNEIRHQLGFETPSDKSDATEVEQEADPTKRSSSDPDLLEMISSAILSSSQQQQQKNITDIVATIRDRSRQDGAVEDRQMESSFLNLLTMLDEYKEEIQRVVETYGKHLDMDRLRAPALMYYLEREDEVKNPSWKRRQHRFFPGIGSTEMDQLNSALQLSALSYADSEDEIEAGLAELDPNYRIVACTVESGPGKPAHFLAVHKDSKGNVFTGKHLRALLVVRGSKSVADTLTDIMCDPVSYRGGKAHSFILESGQYIANKYRELLIELSQSAGLSSSGIDLTIVGHSLGAGAGTIAAMELNDDPNFNVSAIGFGGPAILSQELATGTSTYVTSVVNNDDVVPRMSGASIANVLSEILEFDWIDYAEHDITLALEEFSQGIRLPKAAKKTIVERMRPLLVSVAPDFSEDRPKPRHLDLELFPAGKCIHLYRDGVGISGCIVPNTFFNKIDVSRTLVTDHLIHTGYELTLLDVERQRTGNHFFQFDQASL